MLVTQYSKNTFRGWQHSILCFFRIMLFIINKVSVWKHFLAMKILGQSNLFKFIIGLLLLLLFKPLKCAQFECSLISTQEIHPKTRIFLKILLNSIGLPYRKRYHPCRAGMALNQEVFSGFSSPSSTADLCTLCLFSFLVLYDFQFMSPLVSGMMLLSIPSVNKDLAHYRLFFCTTALNKNFLLVLFFSQNVLKTAG